MSVPAAPVDLRGRDDELARIDAQIRRVRVVTLWGPGGIGKTSLALAAIPRLRDRHDDVAFASLSADATFADALRTIAAALGVVSDDLEAGIGAALGARRRVLLVIDEAEALAADVARAIVAWSATAPEARFLVTSREPLGVRDEIVVEVGPLAVPGATDDPLAFDAVRLLLDRARAARHGFDAPPELLRRLAARTEGIPLAIELCAARLDVLSAEQLDARLATSLDVLRSPRRDVDDKHRTLVASIDVSHRMLDDDERAALAQLAVFPGDFDLEAAEAVVRVGRAAIDVVESLVRKSLVRRKAADTGEIRFGLFEVVRTFVRTEDQGAFQRYAAHVVARAGAAASEIDGANGAVAVARLARLETDLVTIVDAMSEGLAGALLALAPLALVRGPVGSVLARAEKAIGALSGVARARVVVAIAPALVAEGRLDEARQRLEEAAEALAGHPADRARALVRLAETLRELGDRAAADSAAAQSLASGYEEGPSLAALGATAHIASDLAVARERYEAALAVFRRTGNEREAARTLSRIGFLAYDEGRNAEARARFEESLAAFERLSDNRLRAYAIGYVGNVLRADGAYDDAVDRYDDAVAILQRAGDRFFEGVFRMDRGIARLLAGDAVAAREDLDVAAAIAEEGREAQLGGLTLGYRAIAASFAGDRDAARASLEAARGKALLPTPRACAEIHAWTIAVDAGAVEDARAFLAAARPATEHERIALRLLARAIDRVAPPDDALVVSFGGRRLRVPGGATIDLVQRGALAAIMEALVEARRATPGEPVASATLLSRGWPGERVKKDAGAIRVRVAIAQLRKMGLAAVLERVHGGYRLDPNVRVVDG